jgi:hypothetical protein
MRLIYRNSFDYGIDDLRQEGRMIRVLVIGLMLLIAVVVPAFAEKVTLACSYSPETVTSYLTIDTDAKTVTVSEGGDNNGTFPAQITDEAVTFDTRRGPSIYRRQSALWYFNGAGIDYPGEQIRAAGPIPCVRAPAPPF